MKLIGENDMTKKLIKYKITFKYNEPEYILASSKEEALYDWKEGNTTIALRGKGCDKIVSCETYKEYTDAEWETHLDKVHQEKCNNLVYSFKESYKELDNGDIVNSNGKFVCNRHRR